MFTFNRSRSNKTGIGLAGVDGVWWLPACRPFVLPEVVASDLAAIGSALFAFYDVVAALYGTAVGDAGGLNQLLHYKVPPHIPRLPGRGRVLSVRPDFQLIPRPSGSNGRDSYQLAITELEICPSAHGFAHAMQIGYGLTPDLVNGFVAFLNGRELRIISSGQWSEFLFDQLAFCRALHEAGGRARLFLDGSIRVLADEVRHGRCWQPPLFAIHRKPAGWTDDLLGRIEQHGLATFLWPDDVVWPAEAADAVIFRFGYLDCLSPTAVTHLARWQNQGATFLNPPHLYLESKSLLACLNLPLVRDRLMAVGSQTLALLDQTIPETVLLLPENLDRFVAEKDEWIVKYAAFDGGNQAWGGRSIAFGLANSRAEWRRLLQEYAALPWPVVGQRARPSAVVDIAYFDETEAVRMMRNGRTRLRVFLLRSEASGEGETALACGAHLTVSGGSWQVAEATDAVQTPLVFST
jgi:hypothetical protein